MCAISLDMPHNREELPTMAEISKTLISFSVISFLALGMILVEACNVTVQPLQLQASDRIQYIEYPGASEDNCNWIISNNNGGSVLELKLVFVNLNVSDYIYVKDVNGYYIKNFSTELSEPVHTKGQIMNVSFEPHSSGRKTFILSYSAVPQYRPPETTPTAHRDNMNTHTTTTPDAKSKTLWIVSTVAPIVGVIIFIVFIFLFIHFIQKRKAVPFSTFRN